MTTLRRLTSLTAVIAMLLTLTAVPALAAEASATITTGDLLSGRDGQVNLRITNDAMPVFGSSVDAFVIEVPQDLVSVAAGDVVLPDGWSGGYDGDVGFVFGQAEDGSELAPGSSIDVGIGVSALAIPDDRTRGFTTSVSDNDGLTLANAGSPEVTTRILELVETRVQKPGTATNDDASQLTAGQDTAQVGVRVVNHGSEAREVTVDVAAVDGDSSLTETAPGTVSLAPGQDATTAVPVTVGGPGALTLQGVATTDDSAANPGNDEAVANVTVQPAFAANLVADSLQPTGAAQGTETDIQYKINKTAGAQPVTADATFSFDSFSTEAAQDFDAANGEKTVLFPDVTIPDLDNGEYDTTSTINGVDANGATVDLTLAPGKLILDNLLPSIEFDLDVGETDVANTTPATTDGRPIAYSGSITLGDSGDACSDCTITEAVLVAEPSGEELPMAVANDEGTLSNEGSLLSPLTGDGESFTFPEATTSAYARITVERGTTGASASAISNTVEVDLVVPGMVNPGETRRGETRDTIVIDLGDDGGFLDASQTRAIDWSVDNNVVVSVAGNPSRESASQVVLNLMNRLDDNATPTVSYNYQQNVSGLIHDRVSIPMFDQTVNTVDRIVPAAPLILGVDDLGPQDGEFYTNNSAPEVALSGLDAGNLLEIFYDTNDNGEPDDGELVYTAEADSETETVTLDDLGNVNESADLIARMTDDAGNLGNLGTATLNLDFTAARIIDFTVDGQDVTVQFDEPVVRGRDAAFDWTVQATQDGTTAFRTVTQVSEGADSAQRVLTINSSSYDASAEDAAVLAVRYKFRGSDPADRYEDRATNLFADVLFTKD